MTALPGSGSAASRSPAPERTSVLGGFKSFILRGNVVELAVAVVVGTAFTAVVKSIVSDLLTPLIAALAGKANFANLKFTVHRSAFFYGDVINNIITFLLVATVIYFGVVLPTNLVAHRRSADLGTAPQVPPDVALLTEIRDLLRPQAVPAADPDAGSGPAEAATSAGSSSSPVSGAPEGAASVAPTAPAG